MNECQWSHERGTSYCLIRSWYRTIKLPQWRYQVSVDVWIPDREAYLKVVVLRIKISLLIQVEMRLWWLRGYTVNMTGITARKAFFLTTVIIVTQSWKYDAFKKLYRTTESVKQQPVLTTKALWQEKKEDIWLSPMTKAHTPTEK